MTAENTFLQVSLPIIFSPLFWAIDYNNLHVWKLRGWITACLQSWGTDDNQWTVVTVNTHGPTLQKTLSKKHGSNIRNIYVINRSKDDINISWDMGRDEKQKDLCSFDIINFSNKNKKFSVFIMLNGCGIFGFSLLLQSSERNKQPLNLSNVMLKENRSSSKWMRWSCVVFHKCSTISFAVVQAANLCVYPRSVIVKSSISHFKKSFSV